MYTSSNIFLVIKSRRMRCAGHVARIGGKKRCIQVLVGKPEGKRPLGRPGVDGRIILRWIFRKWGRDWIDEAQGRDRWREIVHAVLKLRVP